MNCKHQKVVEYESTGYVYRICSNCGGWSAYYVEDKQCFTGPLADPDELTFPDYHEFMDLWNQKIYELV